MSSTTPPPPAPEPSGGASDGGQRPSSGPDRLFTWLREAGLRRNTSDRWIGGVCSGIAERFGVDPLVIRAVTLALFLFGGIGFLLYMIAWAFIPARDGRIKAEEALRGDAGGIVLLVVIGLSLIGEVTNRQWWWVMIPVGLVVWFVVRGMRCGQSPQEIGADAKARAQEVARTVQGWAQTSPAGSSSADAASGTPSGPPHGMGPGRTWAPSTPTPVREVVVRERRRGIGFLGVVVVLGMAVLAFGIAAALEWTDRPVAFALASAVGVLGLGLLVVALAGRRAGGLATLGIAAALAAGLAATAPAMAFSNLSAGVGERTWQPVDQEAPQAYQLGAGEARLDLGALKPEGPKEQPISASLSVGEMVVVVPAGVTVRVDAKVGTGELVTRTGTEKGTKTDEQGGAHLQDSVTVGSGTPDAVVTADVGLGSLTIVTP
jgi:phage shock protein PspC (stress-responsive transcriptional regulator)